MVTRLTFKECSPVALRAFLNEFPIRKLRSFAKRNGIGVCRSHNLQRNDLIAAIVDVKDSIDATIQVR